jgi:twitching motility protein PilT
VFRVIPSKILTAEQLGLPPITRKFAELTKGLVLVTGPTGSGKSTTLAAIVDHANKIRKDHIITVEDPIEFVHASQGCLVNHREVGMHTKSFAAALRGALREDPDVILVGEMRDLETIELALTAAATGHLVLEHCIRQARQKPSIASSMSSPADQQNQIRNTLPKLKGVVAQNLMKRIDVKWAALRRWKFWWSRRQSRIRFAKRRRFKFRACCRSEGSTECRLSTMPYWIS